MFNWLIVLGMVCKIFAAQSSRHLLDFLNGLLKLNLMIFIFPPAAISMIIIMIPMMIPIVSSPIIVSGVGVFVLHGNTHKSCCQAFFMWSTSFVRSFTS